MGDLVDHLADEFKAPELVIIAEVVGLSPTSSWGNRRLTRAIMAKVRRDGIPTVKGKDRKASLTWEFLVISGYTDDEGKPLSDDERRTVQGDDYLDLEEHMEEFNIPSTPDCFSFADDGSPECKRCVLYRHCADERIVNLPACFGTEMFDRRNAECTGCLEAPFCVEAQKEVATKRKV